jgi:hypothetical protein
MSTAIAIPADPGLIGATFYHQVVAVEVGPTGAIATLTSTNGLVATVGLF